jgi:allantoicase
VVSDAGGDRSGLQRLKELSLPARRDALLGCCASRRWADTLARELPACQGTDDVLSASEQAWWRLTPQDWREALNAHPKIGERTVAGSIEDREQGVMASAGPAVRSAIDDGNRSYEKRFGMTYVIRAAGRSAEEMLHLLRLRLTNDPETELRIAAAQQAEITRLRLESLLGREAA